jgi:hypothetical protein
MRFAVIENREWSGHSSLSRPLNNGIDSVAVEAEARRRKGMAGLDEWQLREYVTGLPIPSDLRNLCLQIDYAAQAISRLSPIPADFTDDIYWPRVW